MLLVCSAVAGVTDLLGRIADTPRSAGLQDELIAIHTGLGSALGVPEDRWLGQAKSDLGRFAEKLRREPAPASQAELLALGEFLSTRIGHAFLQQSLEAGWVDARQALQVIDEPELSDARRWLSARCEAGEDPALAARWSALEPVLVTQGYMARTRDGATAVLGRGGSDTSAALLAGRLAAERLEIWTDVPGLFTADPRLLPEARLLTHVDYHEALEMAASGARVVHPRSIRAAAATNTAIAVRDLARPELAGTLITAAAPNESGIKAVTCQQDMAVLLLQNLDTRHEVGFLAAVFEIFRRRGISVDLVATSETTTTVAVNCAANHLGQRDLDELASDLKQRCRVDLFDDCACVNLVGRGARTALARLQDTLRHFEDRPLLMLSQSANDLCISLLVHSEDSEPLLRAAHRSLFGSADASGSAFGPDWASVKERA